jgi:long-subunit acyl-CoA synthetase (AMP-forming)
MANYSQAHICQCLTRLSTLRSTSVVTISGNRQKTGHQFVGDVLSLAHGLLQLGLGNGDIVAICGFNRFLSSSSSSSILAPSHSFGKKQVLLDSGLYFELCFLSF